MFCNLVSGHSPEMDLVRTIGQPQRPGPGEQLTQREVGVEAAPSMGLDGPVHHGEAHPGGHNLDHGDLRCCNL